MTDIDPTQALSVGAEVVDDMTRGLPRKQRGTAAERAQAVLDIARFLLGEELVEEVEEETEEGAEETPTDDRLDLSKAVPVGPARRVQCMVSTGDFAYVRAGKTEGTPFVGLEVQADGEHSAVYLSIADARRFAAGLLDAADEAEGGSPLLAFVKPDA